jgi:hypothetical protein
VSAPPPYPSTRHLAGSLGVPGGADRVPARAVAGRWGVVEEKLDGDMVGFGFDAGADLSMVAHGAFVAPGDRRFAPARRWAEAREDALFDRLGDRYWLFGECLAWTHSVFYDALPDVVLEYDVWDAAEGAWLSTPRRRALLGPVARPVPVLWEGPLPDAADLPGLARRSAYRSAGWPAER